MEINCFELTKVSKIPEQTNAVNCGNEVLGFFGFKKVFLHLYLWLLLFYGKLRQEIMSGKPKINKTKYSKAKKT